MEEIYKKIYFSSSLFIMSLIIVLKCHEYYVLKLIFVAIRQREYYILRFHFAYSSTDPQAEII